MANTKVKQEAQLYPVYMIKLARRAGSTNWLLC